MDASFQVLATMSFFVPSFCSWLCSRTSTTQWSASPISTHTHTQQISLCLSPFHSSSPFVRLRWPYRWQYRLRHQCIGTKSWGEQWERDRETWQRMRRVRPSLSLSAFWLPCCLCFYHSACLQKCLKSNRAVAVETLLNANWDLVLMVQRVALRPQKSRDGLRGGEFTLLTHYSMGARSMDNIADSQCRWLVSDTCSKRDFLTGRGLEDSVAQPGTATNREPQSSGCVLNV